MIKVPEELIAKYNVAAPRYTSYPTVPFWENELFTAEGWMERLKVAYRRSEKDGISIYVHLPFCESLCTYCGCNTRITKNHAVEDPYIAHVLKEWGMYKAALGETLVISEIHFGGGTPTFFEAANLKRLVKGLLENAVVRDDATFSFEAHPGNTSTAHLQTLYDLGFKRLSLGIQDFDEEVQRVINRKQSVEDVQRVMRDARAIGYTSINFDLIYGLPLQTRASVEDTILQALRLSPDRISFYSYAHVPWIKRGQRSFTEKDLPVGQEKLALYKLGKQLIEDAGYHDVGMDHFAKEDDTLCVAAAEGKLHRNFMGYADRYVPVLIGLGVSSISDAWTAFAQNVKTVEEYYKMLDEDKLPVVKGHFLTADDLVIRGYILDMMCRGNLILQKDFYLNQEIIERLQPLVADELVNVEGETVRVTDLGKSFLRNICMTFDQRLQDSRSDKQLFSQAI